MNRASLRLRLFVLILTPLVLMAILLGYWRYSVAKQTAEELFDRSLLSAALAISRDVVISQGDVLLRSTRDLIEDAAGGEVFYHATGPGGIYVTGYAYPPSVRPEKPQNNVPQYAIGEYRNEFVRVLQITETVSIENLTGDATTTVWQRLQDRQEFARQLAFRAAALIGGLLMTLALVVWFGVARGLRPLISLQDAISKRSAEDLSHIKRFVPSEVEGIVKTLNRLFGQVEQSMDAHQAFISDAAHQLRNPAAAVQSMAEALRDAPTDEDRNQRISELIKASRGSARIAEQLLSLDRLQQPMQQKQFEKLDIRELVQETCADLGAVVLSQSIDFELILPDRSVYLNGDRIYLAEALKNLVDNALKHGGDCLSKILVSLSETNKTVELTVADDGKGLKPDQSDVVFSRFSQVEPSDGSGLGMAIVEKVALRHGGKLTINDVKLGASLTLSIPRC